MKALPFSILLLILILSGCLATSENKLNKSSEILQQDKNFMDVFVKGDSAYVTSNWGLYIINLSNEVKPEIIGKFKTPGQAEGIFVRDGIAYIADGLDGLVIVNVSNLSSPTVISNLSYSGNFKRVVVEGDIAYIGDFNPVDGLVVVNISDARNPRVISSYNLPGYGHVRDFYINRHLIFLADFTGGLKILNKSLVTEKENPLIANVPLNGVAYSVTTLGKYAVVACSDAGLALMDISNISDPRVLSYKIVSQYAIKVRSYRNIIYVTTGNDGIISLKINGNSLEELGRYNTGGNAFGFFIRKNRIYLADYNKGLIILNISRPENIEEISDITPRGEVY
ncbi:LVIVD repeat protein [archaeon BMS3Bbin15]|nr:LVIVD repeat protein [archaeon BMS3Bbin15]